jgi:hypothetical protein
MRSAAEVAAVLALLGLFAAAMAMMSLLVPRSG